MRCMRGGIRTHTYTYEFTCIKCMFLFYVRLMPDKVWHEDLASKAFEGLELALCCGFYQILATEKGLFSCCFDTVTVTVTVTVTGCLF